MGIYGTALAYRYTGDELCRELFRKVTDFYLEHLPEDGSYWDLSFWQGSSEPRDSLPPQLQHCGIMEMCENGG